MLKCYDCAEEGKDTEAVSICIVCGKGVCMDHVKELDVPLKGGGYPLPHKALKKPLPRMLCKECVDTILKEGFCV